MMRALLFTVLALPPQDAPQSKPESEPAASRPAPKPVRRLSDKEASDLTARFRARMKKKPPPGLSEKLREVEHLATVSHDKVVTLVEQVLKDESSAVVKKEAAKALAVQPVKSARKLLLAALADPKHGETPEVIEALIKSLDRNGYDKADLPLLEKFFPDAEGIVQIAVVRLLAAHDDKGGARILVELLDEPEAKDPTAGSNPPAEYWEKRWKAWRYCRDEVRALLERWTAQKFVKSEEARAWLQAHGASVGITKW